MAVSRTPDIDDGNSLVLNYRDISERKHYEEELTRQAFEDPLTGLANRALFTNRLAHALTQRSQRRCGVAVPRPRPLQDRQRQPGA